MPALCERHGGGGILASQRRELALGAGSLSGGYGEPAFGDVGQFHHYRYHRDPEWLEDGEPEVIGEVDFSSALTTVHPKAIYLHQGQQYHVEQLDFEQRKAYVKSVNVDYYTDAIRYTQVRVLEMAEEERIAGPAARVHGDVLVRSQVVGFKKIKFFTNENIGAGKLELPENEMHTTAFWITLERQLLTELPYALSDRQSGIFGLLYALESMATLLLMCDRRDLGTAVGERPPSPGVETRVAGIQRRRRLTRRR